jgi:hypothetical protein
MLLDQCSDIISLGWRNVPGGHQLKQLLRQLGDRCFTLGKSEGKRTILDWRNQPFEAKAHSNGVAGDRKLYSFSSNLFRLPVENSLRGNSSPVAGARYSPTISERKPPVRRTPAVTAQVIIFTQQISPNVTPCTDIVSIVIRPPFYRFNQPFLKRHLPSHLLYPTLRLSVMSRSQLASE